EPVDPVQSCQYGWRSVPFAEHLDGAVFYPLHTVRAIAPDCEHIVILHVEIAEQQADLVVFVSCRETPGVHTDIEIAEVMVEHRICAIARRTDCDHQATIRDL